MDQCLGWTLLTVTWVISAEGTPPTDQPNIIFILADDLGYNDVPYNNPEIVAPNLKNLAEQGLVIDQHYVQPVCTPSRAALMTGVYPFHMGRQHKVLRMIEPAGVPLRYKMLPRALKELGYDTHMIGKWHLGFCSEDYLPTSRGFDTFIGFYTGSIHYYTCGTGQSEDYHLPKEYPSGLKRKLPGVIQNQGYDFRKNTDVFIKSNNEHNAYLYEREAERMILGNNQTKPFFLYLSLQQPHTPLMADEDMMLNYKNITSEKRRSYLGLVTSIDRTVETVRNALKRTGLDQNTIIIFTSDNGGAICCGGDNTPLRGIKNTLFEGGTRAPAVFYHPRLKYNKEKVRRLMHITDWYPTLLHFAGGSFPDYLDGVDQYGMLTQNLESPRRELVYNIDNEVPFEAALRDEKYKLLLNCMPVNVGRLSKKVKHMQTDLLRGVNIDFNCRFTNGLEFVKMRLYNIEDDPAETKNLIVSHKNIARQLLKKLEYHMSSLKPAAILDDDPNGVPKAPDFVYEPGWCDSVY